MKWNELIGKDPPPWDFCKNKHQFWWCHRSLMMIMMMMRRKVMMVVMKRLMVWLWGGYSIRWGKLWSPHGQGHHHCDDCVNSPHYYGNDDYLNIKRPLKGRGVRGTWYHGDTITSFPIPHNPGGYEGKASKNCTVRIQIVQIVKNCPKLS